MGSIFLPDAKKYNMKRALDNLPMVNVFDSEMIINTVIDLSNKAHGLFICLHQYI